MNLRPPAADRPDDPALTWRRIDARSIVVGAVPQVAATWLAVLLIRDSLPLDWPIVHDHVAAIRDHLYRGGTVLAVVVVISHVLRWVTSSYVVQERTVRYRTGWLVRRSVALDRRRIGAIVLRDGVLARPLGVTAVALGTAESLVDASIDLAWIPTATARRLRHELLDHAEPQPATPGVLARNRASWAWWAPFSALSVSLWVGTYAVVYQLFVAYFAWWRTLQWLLSDEGRLRAAVRVLVVVPVLVGVVGSVLVYLAFWWGFTLERSARGTLETRYGLVVRRSMSLQESRLRGIEMVQPLLPRIVHRARLLAVTTGVGAQRSLVRHLAVARRRTLLPLGPSVEAARAAVAVLDRDLDLAHLLGHPPQARWKRYRWAAFVVTTALLLGWLLLRHPFEIRLETFLVTGLLALVLALVVADDNYRSLGHRLDPDLLLIRSGTIRRTTTVLQRRAVVGWVFQQSWFQYRLGLVSAVASTAAGQGSYTVHDVGCVEAVELARVVTPGPISQHLHPRAAGAPDRLRG